MAQFNPVSVIGPQFVATNSFEIIVDKLSAESLMVSDIYHRILLKSKPCDTSFHRQRMLLDANDTPIVTLREKNMSAHEQWNVFRGESDKESDLIFSTKTAHVINLKTCVNVSLATSNKGCDFKLEGKWKKKDCTIYLGDSSTVIAQMHAVEPIEKNAKDKFMVTIYPNVDYAFVMALVAIVDTMKTPVKSQVAGQVGGSLGEAIGGALAG